MTPETTDEHRRQAVPAPIQPGSLFSTEGDSRFDTIVFVPEERDRQLGNMLRHRPLSARSGLRGDIYLPTTSDRRPFAIRRA
jgi:hypothetical protein